MATYREVFDIRARIEGGWSVVTRIALSILVLYYSYSYASDIGREFGWW